MRYPYEKKGRVYFASFAALCVNSLWLGWGGKGYEKKSGGGGGRVKEGRRVWGIGEEKEASRKAAACEINQWGKWLEPLCCVGESKIEPIEL